MFELLKKDFLLVIPKRSSKGKAANALLSVFLFGFFLAVEIFLFVHVMRKISSFANVPESVFTVFLLIVLVITIISGVVHAERLFFSPTDLRQVGFLPIPNHKIILSKLIVLFSTEFATTFLLSYPLFVAYSIIFGMPAYFFITSLLYPLCSFLLEACFVLIFIIPLHLLLKFFKNHPIAFAITVICVSVLFSFLYYTVLAVFISFVTENSSALFTERNIHLIQVGASKVIPLIWLVRGFVSGSVTDLIMYFVSAVGLLTIGILVCVGAYSPSMRHIPTKRKKAHTPDYRKSSVNVALVKKELSRLTQSGHAFGFLGLLVIQPILLFLVISAINQIFTSGIFQFYTTLVPQLIPVIDILTVLLFVNCINQGASDYIADEGNMTRMLSALPISPKKHMLIKLAIPYVLSALSLIVSGIVIGATKQMDALSLSGALVLSLILLAAFEYSSYRCGTTGKKALMYIYLYGLPIGFCVITLLLSVIKIPLAVSLGVAVVLFMASAMPFVLALFRKSDKGRKDL